MTARCWCNRPANGSCSCCCAEHDQAPPVTFQVFGVTIPASVARDADDGVTVMEPDGFPVQRWRTDTAKRPRNTDGGPSLREFLQSKGEIA